MKIFIKYRDYNDRKVNAVRFKVEEYCLLLTSELYYEHTKFSNMRCKWMAHYKVEDVLTRSD